VLINKCHYRIQINDDYDMDSIIAYIVKVRLKMQCRIFEPEFLKWCGYFKEEFIWIDRIVKEINQKLWTALTI
jgi:hypothetical protein